MIFSSRGVFKLHTRDWKLRPNSLSLSVTLAQEGQIDHQNMSSACSALNVFHSICVSAPQATQGRKNGFLSQLPEKCHLEEVASVGD